MIKAHRRRKQQQRHHMPIKVELLTVRQKHRSLKAHKLKPRLIKAKPRQHRRMPLRVRPTLMRKLKTHKLKPRPIKAPLRRPRQHRRMLLRVKRQTIRQLRHKLKVHRPKPKLTKAQQRKPLQHRRMPLRVRLQTIRQLMHKLKVHKPRKRRRHRRMLVRKVRPPLMHRLKVHKPKPRLIKAPLRKPRQHRRMLIRKVRPPLIHKLKIHRVKPLHKTPHKHQNKPLKIKMHPPPQTNRSRTIHKPHPQHKIQPPANQILTNMLTLPNLTMQPRVIHNPAVPLRAQQIQNPPTSRKVILHPLTLNTKWRTLHLRPCLIPIRRMLRHQCTSHPPQQRA